MSEEYEKLSFFGLLFELEKTPEDNELKKAIQKRLDIEQNTEQGGDIDFGMTDIEKFM